MRLQATLLPGSRKANVVDFMEAQIPKVIVTYTTIAVAATVTLTNVSKIILEWHSQEHTVKKAVVQQSHETAPEPVALGCLDAGGEMMKSARPSE